MPSRIVETVRALAAGDLHPFGGPRVHGAVADRLRAAQVAALTRYMPVATTGSVIAAMLVMLLFGETPAAPYVLVWVFGVCCFSIYLYLQRRAARGRSQSAAESRATIARAVRNAAIGGLAWALLPFIALPHNPQHASLLLCALIGVMGGGAFALSSLSVAAIAFIAPIAVASASVLAYLDRAAGLFVTGLLAVYLVSLMRAVIIYSVQFAHSMVEQIGHEKAATTDALTGAPNRFGFEERCKMAAATAARLGDSYAVFSIDLDGLKSMNDQFGHAAGDEFLRQAAERIRSCLREVDAMARLGGDEFAALAANIDNPRQASTLAQRILRAFEQPFVIGERELVRTLSIGIAFLPGDGRDVESVLAKADAALYVAKRQGGGAFRFHHDKDNFEVVSRKRIEEDLPKSIESDEFHIELQPFVALDTLQVSGFEALLRWTHPTLGVISPADFVPLAEKLGRINALGERMIPRAMAMARDWPAHLRLAINMSPAQLSAPHLPLSFERWLRAADLDPRMIELEITETAMMDEGLGARAALQALRDIGVHIALDDFGVGFSSLSRVADLPIDRLKIDRSLVQNALNSRRHAVVLEMALKMARELGLQTTAEGVETEGHLAMVRNLGFHEGQGFLLGHAMSEALAQECVTRGLRSAA